MFINYKKRKTHESGMIILNHCKLMYNYTLLIIFSGFRVFCS